MISRGQAGLGRPGKAWPDLVAGASATADGERGDVPGWVLVTLMTAGMVTVIWGVAQSSLVEVFTNAIDGITAP